MNDAQRRLSRCFSAVFPGLSREQISAVSVETTEAWDSVASVTLISLIQEEFGIDLETDAIDHLVSFGAILDYLNGLPERS